MSASGVFPSKPSALLDIFGTERVLIGVVHSLPLPGSPRYEGQPLTEVYQYAVEEAQRYREGGFHGVIVENAWDLPFAKPEDLGFETAATMGVMTNVVREHVNIPVGVNVLANGALCAIAAAQAGGGQFVRANQWVNAYIANEGFIEGAAAAALRYRAHLRDQNMKVFADVHVKHGSHAIIADRTLSEQTEDAEFFDADVLIATGTRTGSATSLDEVEGISASTQLPVIIGSGMHEENAEPLLRACQGAIVGSSLKTNNRWWGPVDLDKVRRFAEQAWRIGYEAP